MSHPPVPLSVLDLSPISSGSTPADALRRTIDLAQAAERAGYRRYWLAEHHLNPGVAGASPAVVAAIVAQATRDIRVGSAAVLLGNYSPLQIAEQWGVIAALHPGRIDLGIGRSGIGRPSREKPGTEKSGTEKPGAEKPGTAGRAPDSAPQDWRVVDGVVIPPARPAAYDPVRWELQARLLGRAPGDGDFGADVRDILGFFAGTYVAPEGRPVVVTPAEGTDAQLWVHGSSAGPSAQLAGELGLPYGANYHVAPATLQESVAAYRDAFRPSERFAQPYVIVSVDVVVGADDAAARELAVGYGPWVQSIRSGQGAIPYPDAEEARQILSGWGEDDHAAVRDRTETQLVGSSQTVVGRLAALQRLTGADELLVTTVTHRHEDRVRSYELLADAWAQQATPVAVPTAAAGGEAPARVAAPSTVDLLRVAARS
ncbi:MsnO8 family LLM class oxidoreductase [Cellulomonas cellasea]|uniref:MsnO8 family LLM class oxidoreductase n=1 Tax=Cellulomonas cellasea TaxID=43670 RepID=UPI0025A48F87|nr:MsnO8 family LLM class oxidoreductase [Cellulomonas cellasea]MDM8083460.1 MsnO8 family LLM class oxidoreductase [Cellulomonas cellasea]